MTQLKNPRKLWSTSSLLQKRQNENVQRGRQASPKDFSSRQKEKFRGKNSRKLFFRDLDNTTQKIHARVPDAKRDQGGVQLESDEQTVISAKSKSHKNPKIRALRKASQSDRVSTNNNLVRKVSLDRNLERKDALDEKEDFGLRMDFVDCKCKFGINDVLTPWQSVNTVVEFPFLEAEQDEFDSNEPQSSKGQKTVVEAVVEPVLHPGGSESINLGLVQGLGALSLHGEPSVDLLDQRNPEKYLNSDVVLLKQVIGGPPLFYSDTKKLRKDMEF